MDRGIARNLAKSFIGEISDTTRLEYERAWGRLDGMHWHTYAYEHDVTTTGGDLLRAAWRRGAAQELLDAIRDSEKLPTPEQRREARQRMDALAKSLMDDRDYGTRYHQSSTATKKGSRSKKHSLAKLPPHWREAVLDCTPDRDRACVVALIMGARPEEVRKGVNLSVSGDLITAEIQGAKVDDKTSKGQEVRRVTLSHAQTLIEALGMTDGQSITAQTEGRGLQARVRRLGVALGLEISCYSFRHAWASDMKAAGVDPTDLAKAMGHRSIHTQRAYGYAWVGRRGGGQSLSDGLKAVSATHEPKGANPHEMRAERQMNEQIGQIVMMNEQPNPADTPSYSRSPSPFD